LVLTIDVGNTNIVIGGFADDKLMFMSRVSTDTKKTEDEYAVLLNSVVSMYGYDKSIIDGGIISSVVPPITMLLKSAMKKAFNINALIVGPGIKTGVKILNDNPAQTGADLVCGAVAAIAKYKMPAIIFDLGTATTITALDEKGTFLGGSIIPGIKISLDALSDRTAQLPHISLEAPDTVIGSNTIDAMKSGVVLGNASMIDGMIERYREVLGENMTVIATGGLSEVIIKNCRNKIIFDDRLLLDGLYILYCKNTKQTA